MFLNSCLIELPEESELDCALKVKWKRKRFDFSESDLTRILDPIGSVDSVALTQKKKGGAIVVFKTVVDAYHIITKKDTHPSLSQFESIDWATGKAPALVEKMNRAEEMKKEARAALFSTNDRPTAATGKPLFSTGSQPSFFKPMSIPSFKVLFPHFLWCSNPCTKYNLVGSIFLCLQSV